LPFSRQNVSDDDGLGSLLKVTLQLA
jgi:hypothetical protein